MRLRSEAAKALQARMQEAFPEALETAWDTSAVLVMVENLNFKSASGYKGDWQRKASFDGVLRAELRTGDVDSSLPELLAVSLAGDPVFVRLPDPGQTAVAEGEAWPKARLVFKDLRDTVRDQAVIGALRFDVSGEICLYAPDPGRPDAKLRDGLEERLILGDAA
ncbi:hypothetical protein [Leisingera sp. MMG026]|uniref:hypothetical protein n=1 Tax=Leisingera sp. MMG026 TaxID=2909982 RepID=UPI001F375B69|nr:hypothetical protein [Leisingera sp. MMG026]MCF6432660.1 hypothetical protein [Leisingera sp. MMG026]